MCSPLQSHSKIQLKSPDYIHSQLGRNSFVLFSKEQISPELHLVTRTRNVVIQYIIWSEINTVLCTFLFLYEYWILKRSLLRLKTNNLLASSFVRAPYSWSREHAGVWTHEGTDCGALAECGRPWGQVLLHWWLRRDEPCLILITVCLLVNHATAWASASHVHPNPQRATIFNSSPTTAHEAKPFAGWGY